MKVLIASDIHCEFHRDFGRSLVQSFPDADVIVLAGDITVMKGMLVKAFDQFTDRYPHVVFVSGNHEYYGNHVSYTEEKLAEYAASHANFHWLNKSAVTIDGQRFIGGTLWFPKVEGIDFQKRWLNDYRVIHGFAPWVYEQNKATSEYLAREVVPTDIVVTHHLPSPKCVVPRYEGSPYNCFFVSDETQTILERKPKLWVFGHTHDVVDLTIGETRLVCNPFGYAEREENPQFNRSLVLDV